MASQIASTLFGAHVVSVVRKGSKSQQEFDELVNYLTTMGKNTLVIAQEDLQDKESIQKLQSQLQNLSTTTTKESPKKLLALNAVGGDSAKILLKLLDSGGTLVTYGGMSGKPVIVATPLLIFKNVQIVGYWHSLWMSQEANQSTKQEMMDTLAKAVLQDKIFCPPVGVFGLEDFQEGLQWQSNQRAIRSKLVWDCQEEHVQ